MPALVIAVASFLVVFFERSGKKRTKKIERKARPARERPN
jgi:hypothetical protein